MDIYIPSTPPAETAPVNADNTLPPDFMDYDPTEMSSLQKTFDDSYDNERELFDVLTMEAYNMFGTPFLYYIVSYNKDRDPVFAEDTDRRVERCFEVMGYTPSLPEERRQFTGFGVEITDVVQIHISKMHFQYVSANNRDALNISRFGLKDNDFSLNHITEDKGTGSITWNRDYMNQEFTTEFAIGAPFESYIPKVGDIMKMRYNDFLYEVRTVKEEEEMFHQSKHTWIITLTKYTIDFPVVDQNDHNLDQEFINIIHGADKNNYTFAPGEFESNVTTMEINSTDEINGLKYGNETDTNTSKQNIQDGKGKGKSRILYKPVENEKSPQNDNEGW